MDAVYNSAWRRRFWFYTSSYKIGAKKRVFPPALIMGKTIDRLYTV